MEKWYEKDALGQWIAGMERKSHRLLYFNRHCQESGRGKAVLGARCHEVWPEMCANCPLGGWGKLRPAISSAMILC